MTLVTCPEHPACQLEVDTGTHHPADPQPDSPAERALRGEDPAGHDHPHGHPFREHGHVHAHRLPWLVWAGPILGAVDLVILLWRH